MKKADALKNKADVDMLKKWLEKPGNSALALAIDLGYKTEVTIRNWISRGKLPRRDRDKILNLLRSV